MKRFKVMLIAMFVLAIAVIAYAQGPGYVSTTMVNLARIRLERFGKLGQIFVWRALWKADFQTPKSRNSVRKIDLIPQLVDELNHWKAICPKNEHKFINSHNGQ